MHTFNPIASPFSLKVGAVFDHFGYPAPRLEMATKNLVRSCAAQGLLQTMRSRLARGCPTVAGPIVPATLASATDSKAPPAHSSIGNKAPRTLGQLQVAQAMSTPTSSTSQSGNVPPKDRRKARRKGSR